MRFFILCTTLTAILLPAFGGDVPGPAKRDTLSRPVVAGNRLYYSSSVDDALHCKHAQTGKELWRFITGGPVRIAPSVHDNRVYFGSDDGFAYCVDAESGKLVWKHRPVEPGPLLFNDGNVISRWPCRTGVLVHDGIAYFACSLLPWRESYICAVDASSGKLEGKGLYQKKVENNRTFDGPESLAGHIFRNTPGPEEKEPASVPGGNEMATSGVLTETNRSVFVNTNTEDSPESLAAGPYVRYTGPDSAVVRWWTKVPCPSELEYKVPGRTEHVSLPAVTTAHRTEIKGLKRNTVYKYRMIVNSSPTAEYELDTFFNYCLPTIPAKSQPFKHDPLASTAARFAEVIITSSQAKNGMAVILGNGGGSLALEMARQSNLHIIQLETSDKNVQLVRDSLVRAGAYGTRVRVLKTDSFQHLPFPDNSINLVVSEEMVLTGKTPSFIHELKRIVRPYGGVICLGHGPQVALPVTMKIFQQLMKLFEMNASISQGTYGIFAAYRKSTIPAGLWSHQYGGPQNRSYGWEPLKNVKSTADLTEQWVGRPGTRFHADSQGSKPSPLAVSGRLFVQGHHRAAGIDPYNGTILWSVEIPGMIRMNIPRDTGNWCADNDNVFIAVKNKCWKLDAQTGKFVRFHEIPANARSEGEFDWGYIARHYNLLLGSAVRTGSSYSDGWGGQGWYDKPAGRMAAKVCSDVLFCSDWKSGSNLWSYAEGVIINSTITTAKDKVAFIRSDNDKIISSGSRRIDSAELWKGLSLVALNVQTGRKMFEQPVEIKPGTSMINMAHGYDRFILCVSGPEKYNMYSYDDKNGKRQWTIETGRKETDHGGLLARPAIVKERIYLKPYAYSIITGKKIDKVKFPAEHGCGTCTAADNALIYRADNIVFWNTRTGKHSGWPRLRLSCGLNIIPALGMVLSLEGGGECFHDSWMKTSIGFAPKKWP